MSPSVPGAMEADRLRRAAAAVAASEDQPTAEAVQELLTAAVALYAARRQAGEDWSPLADGAAGLAPTEVLVTVSEMLEAVDVEVFELGLWRTWGAPG
jgi:hypothetical protein